MKKLGVFVGEDNWTFFREIYDGLASSYLIEVYKRKFYKVPLLHGRLNNLAFREGIRSMLYRNDVCFFEWASELLAVASHMPKQCVIVTRLHSFELFDWASKINWDAVDRIILVSKSMQRMFSDLYPKHSSKTEVIYNGRSLDLFHPPKCRASQIKIGMLGRISPIKRIYEVVLAFYSLIQQGHPISLHIAGEPSDDYRYSVAIHRMVKELGLREKVVFYGQVKDTSSWLQKIDIFISNSYWEGQQVALLEAMSSGCYCLSHFWAGAEEMLPITNIYWKDDELQDKIVEFLKLPEPQKRESQMALRTIALEKFDIQKTIFQMRRVLDEIK